jgi:DNA-binding IclR family transcriptional regulator
MVVVPNTSTSTRKESSSVEKSYLIHSLDRAISVLEILSESNVPLSLAEICKQMNLHKSTVHRSLMVLERRELIQRTLGNRFHLGLKLYELGNRAVEQIDLRTRIQPYFRYLATQVGETVHLSILQKTSVIYLDKVEPNYGVCRNSKLGTSNPVYCTSMGKAMLAFQSEEIIEKIVSRIHFVRYTSKTLYTREMLLSALERIRRRGYAVDNEEIELGVRCIGVPILDENQLAIAAVSVSGPTSRIITQNVPMIVKHLQRCCNEISTMLANSKKKKTQKRSPFLKYNEN